MRFFTLRSTVTVLEPEPYKIKQFWPDMIGFKYKMSNIQAAIGCAQLERID